MYLFFVRAFNDIDHITPVVWKMKRGNYPAAVYCIDPEYDIQSDYRLQFLKQMGVKVDSIYNEFDHHLGWLHQIMRMLYLRCLEVRRDFDRQDRQQLSIWSKAIRRMAKRAAVLLYNLIRSKFYDVNCIRAFLDRSQAKVLCFDWIRPHKFVIESLISAAKTMSIPTVALPHGVFLYTNDSVQSESKQEGQFDRYNHFNYVIVQNRLFKETIARSGVAEDKISVLGSARYCKEWMDQNSQILPRKLKSANENSRKLKVIFMTTRPHYRIDVERMLKTFDLLAKLDGIEVMVKPHTRTGKESKIYRDIPLANVDDISSVELCLWADVILVIASSIIIEALVNNKPALYLKYLHGNTVEYEEYKSCWTANNEEELVAALSSLRADPGAVPYTEKDVDRWLAEIIYGGREEHDVLEDYVQFILNTHSNRN
jgi:hypothetical protein